MLSDTYYLHQLMTWWATRDWYVTGCYAWLTLLFLSFVTSDFGHEEWQQKLVFFFWITTLIMLIFSLVVAVSVRF